MMPELKPCPFCGGKAEWSYSYVPNNGADDVRLGCTNKKCLLYKLVDTFCGTYASRQMMGRLRKKWNTRPDGGDSLREALLAAQEALQWVFTCQSYVRIHGTGIQPVPKNGNPQIVKVQLGEVREILLSFGPKLEPVLAQVEAALAEKDGEQTNKEME